LHYNPGNSPFRSPLKRDKVIVFTVDNIRRGENNIMNYKRLYCFITFLIVMIVPFVNAQNVTIPGATLTGDVFWKGNISVTGDVTVAKNGRLIIESGTQILFAANSDASKSGNDKTRTELIVRGMMIAQGNSGKKIIFSSNAPSPRMGDWYGIEFLHNEGGSILDHCIVEYAFNGVTIKNNNVQVTSSEIRYNFNSGIRTEVKARPQILQSIITDNGYAGVVCELGSAPVLRDNVIAQNPIGMVILSLSEPNLGTLRQGANYNPGRNTFANNEDYDIYNHSSKTISAQNNTWSSERRVEIQNKVYDKDDNSKYGTISFRPLYSERQRESNLNRLLLLAQNNADSDSAEGDKETQNKSAEEVAKVSPELKAADVDTPASNVPDRFITDTEPLLASTKTVNFMQGQPEQPVKKKVERQQVQINYDQIFMEPFLDKRRKEFIRKEKFLVTGSLRQIMETGEIRVRVIVGKNGKVESATILKGINGMLDNAVLETIKKYQYKPGTVNGQSVRFSTNEVFRFQ
jgi:TonB family protein